ncbi:MAG: hypothetical protein ABJB74_10600 [Gemmatimonas sp.]
MERSRGFYLALSATVMPLLFVVLANGCTKAGDSPSPSTSNAAGNPARVTGGAIGAPGIAPTYETRDGISVAQFDSSAFTRTNLLAIDTTPIAVLGALDTNPDFDLKHVELALLLSDNTVVGHSRMATKLIVFDSAGRPLRVLSRFGTVPGDVGRLQTVTRAAHDTLVIADFSNRQANRYSADKFVRMTPIGTVVDERADQLAGVLRDGSLVLHNAGLMPDHFGNGRTRVDATLMLIDVRGLSGIIAQVPDAIVVNMRSNWGGKTGPMPLPLRLGPQAQIVVWDSLIATGNGEAYRIDLRNDGGQVVSALEVAATPRAVSTTIRDADLATRLAEFEEWGGTASMGKESLRLRKAWPVADSIATFGGFFVTPKNTLWVTDVFVPGEKMWHATAFSSKHEMIGRLTYTGGGTPIGFGDDRVVIRTMGKDQVVTLSVYRIVHATAPAR